MRLILLCMVLFLGACSGPPLPFEKGEASDADTIKPPWEALVQAGPGADKDLDLETLDGPLPRPGSQTAAAATPTHDRQIANAEGASAGSATSARKKGPAIKAVAVAVVLGAKGRGNSELTAAMRNVLKEAGWPVLAGRREDALLISGKVTLGAADDGQQKVKLVWTVAGPDGNILGDIVQENMVPAGLLDQGWGEEARHAAEAAAEGIFRLIQTFR